MALYRQIHTKIWADSWFESLLPEAKLLFIYLFSNEQTSPSGLYQITIRRIAFDTGLAEAIVNQHLRDFQQAGKVMYDLETSLLWVRKFQDYNQTKADTVKIRIHADVERCPNCAVKSAYLVAYPNDNLNEDEPYSTDSLSKDAGYSTDSLLAAAGQDRSSSRTETEVEVEQQQEPAPPSADALAAPFPDSPDSQSRSPPDPAMRGRYRQRMVALWESENRGPITDQDAKQLVSWCNEYGTNTVWAAMQKALSNKANNLGGYIRTVLESQQTRGP